MGGLSNGIMGLIVAAQLPLAATWFLLTAGIVYLFFFRRMVVADVWWILRWIPERIPLIKNAPIIRNTPWVYRVSLIRPFSDLKVAIYNEIGALVSEDGIRRFKIKNENIIMQKPDTTDVYPNNEILVVSLSQTKKFNAKRTIDYIKKIVYLDVENPQVAQLYFNDNLEKNDPNWFFENFHVMSMVMMCWVVITITLTASNILIFYPMIVKYVWLG